MSTEKLLMQKFGPLLSLEELSVILKRSRDGLRISLSTNSDFAQQWNATKIKVGRRVYFRSAEVARLIDGV